MSATLTEPLGRSSLRARVLPPLLVALPGLLAGLGGLFHPVFLDPGTAERWRLVHLFLVPLFPLVGLAVWAVLRSERGPVALVARLLAAAYAVLYLSLDAIAGIGAPQQVLGTVRRGEPFPPIGDLYVIGDRLGHLGVLALAVAGLLAGGLLFRRHRDPLALAGAVLVVVGCYWHWKHHVFAPRGVLSVVAIGLGTALLELGRRPARSSRRL